MALNSYFNNFYNTSEQDLLEDLTIESIKIYGHDVYYLPRNLTARSDIFQEDRLSVYSNAHLVEVYLVDVEGFQGEGDFLSKFNVQVRDEFQFEVARRRFANSVGTPEGISRPREGDIIYMPLVQSYFIIKFVEHELHNFYQLGHLYTYLMKTELFEYSGEIFDTGYAEIDAIANNFNIEVGNTAVHANGDLVLDANTGRPMFANVDAYDLNHDVFAENEKFQDAATFLDWTETDPFSEGQL